MNVTFYTNFSKKLNSTAIPSGPGTVLNCNLKDNCSILYPILELTISPGYNYAFIPTFGRYYWINEWTFENGLWSAHLSVDVLATWRSSVLGTTAFVEYSSSNYDKDIIDNRIMTSSKKIISSIQSGSPLFNDTGCYILSTISTDANGYNGAVSAYAMSQSELNTFTDIITSSDFLDSVWTGLKSMFSNPMEVIVSCKWVPFAISNLTGVSSTVHLAYNDTGVPAKLLTSNFISNDFSFGIKYIYDNRNFTDSSGYKTVALYLPCIGMVPIDVDALYNTRTVHIRAKCDVVTGDLVYGVGGYDTETISAVTYMSTYAGNCSTNIPLSQTTAGDSAGLAVSGVGVIGGIISTAISLATDKGATAALKGAGVAAMSAVGAIKSAELHTQQNGALSSRIGVKFNSQPYLVSILNTPSEDPFSAERIANQGLPCFKTLNLSTLSGFIKCSNASADITGLEQEIEMINNFLNTGFYKE